MSDEPGRSNRSWTTDDDVELGVVTEPRRRGEVQLCVIPAPGHQLTWVPAAEARRFAMAVLAAAADAEEHDHR